MDVTDYLTITELSRLTHKSRPSLYKYINDYNEGNLDSIPYSIITLFDMLTKEEFNHDKIMSYCEKKFGTDKVDTDIVEVVSLIKDNKDKLNMTKLKEFILEELK